MNCAGDVLMYKAVSDNNVEKLARLVRNGCDIDAFYIDDMNISSKSILHMCCGKGRYDCAKILIDSGAELSVRDKWGQTPLMYCISTEYPDIAELILKKCPEVVNDHDTSGKTSLMCATLAGNISTLKLLIKYDANVNVRNIEGMTPFMQICLSKDHPEELVCEMLEIFINAGADLNTQDYRSTRTALQLACLTKKVKAVEMLLNAGANPNTTDGAGRTPMTNLICLHLKEKPMGADIDDGVMTIVLMLLHAGADINCMTCESGNPLMSSCFVGAEKMVKFLLENGANANVTFPSGVTPLLISTMKRDLVSMKHLLLWNTNLHQRGRVRKGNHDIMLDPMEYALDNGIREAALLYIDAGYDAKRLKYLFKQDDSEIPPKLLEDEYLLAILRKVCSNPETLQNNVKFYLRRLLGFDPKQPILQLHIPKILKSSLLLREILLPQLAQ